MSLAARSQTGNKDPGRELVNFAIGFIVLQTIVLILFYASRYAKTKQISGIEMKYFMPLGYLFCISNALVSILLVKLGGAGRHILDLDLETIVRLGKLFKAEELIYLASVMFPKLAILSLYIRLFMNPIRRLSYATGVFVVATFLGGLLLFAFTCQPFAFNWDKTIPGGHCININMSYAFFSVPNLISDAFILLLPLHPLWKLHVPRSTKIGLLVTFILGSFGIITAIIRFVLFLRSNIRSDPSYQAANTMRWTIMEPAMYQIAATLPTLRPILIKFLSTLSQVSSISRLQKPDGGNSGAVEDTNRDNFVKLDDYHHMHNSKGSKGPGNFSGVLKTTNVSVSSHGIAETDEYKLARHSH